MTWYLSLLLTASECLVLLLQIPLCFWGRATAPQGEPLPLLGKQNVGKDLWEAAEATDDGKESEGEWRMTEKERQKQYIYYLF